MYFMIVSRAATYRLCGSKLPFVADKIFLGIVHNTSKLFSDSHKCEITHCCFVVVFLILVFQGFWSQFSIKQKEQS